MALGCSVTGFFAALFVCRVNPHTSGKRKGGKEDGRKREKEGETSKPRASLNCIRTSLGHAIAQSEQPATSIRPFSSSSFAFLVFLDSRQNVPMCLVDNDNQTSLNPLCCRLTTATWIGQCPYSCPRPGGDRHHCADADHPSFHDLHCSLASQPGQYGQPTSLYAGKLDGFVLELSIAEMSQPVDAAPRSRCISQAQRPVSPTGREWTSSRLNTHPSHRPSRGSRSSARLKSTSTASPSL